jgi:hypothetical protein
MRIAARLLFALAAALLFFSVANAITVRHEIAAYGAEAFRHDARANFALMLDSLAISLPLSILGFLLGWFFSRFMNFLRV